VANQTAIKVRYLNLNDGTQVAAVDDYYGWPVGNPAGETPTAPETVAPKDLTDAPQKYALITDGAKLTEFATTQGLPPAQLATSSKTVDFPGTGTTMIDYVYAPIYTVNFNSNGGTAVTGQTIIQDVVDVASDGKTATAPEPPERTGYSFDGWYLDDGTFLNQYDFSGPVRNDELLYARWRANISLSLSSGNVNFSASPLSGISSDYTIASVETEVPSGYTLSMEANGSDLVCGTNPSWTISSILSDGALSNDTWGYGLGAFDSVNNKWDAPTSNIWRKIPVGAAGVLANPTVPSAVNGDKYGLFFGVKVSYVTPACVNYKQTLRITAVANE
jgi:uncharacterized repeat protein (TIGR02543 family)